jgi:hypothetical protein
MRALPVAVLLLIVTSLTGCQAIADIFQAGVWVGVVAVLLVLGLVGFLFAKMRR